MKNYRNHIIDATQRDIISTEQLAQIAPRNGDFVLNSDDDFAPRNTASSTPVPKLAAVLVPIVVSDIVQVLFTQRASRLRSHSGQVAFPGGRIETDDASPVAAALREVQEEIGLAQSHIEIVGSLDVYATGSGYHVLPVVGFVKPGFNLTPDTREVAEIFDVPLSFLMDERNHQRHSGVWHGKMRHYYAMPYDGHYIWGATAGMIRNLFERGFQNEAALGHERV